MSPPNVRLSPMHFHPTFPPGVAPFHRGPTRAPCATCASPNAATWSATPAAPTLPAASPRPRGAPPTLPTGLPRAGTPPPPRCTPVRPVRAVSRRLRHPPGCIERTGGAHPVGAGTVPLGGVTPPPRLPSPIASLHFLFLLRASVIFSCFVWGRPARGGAWGLCVYRFGLGAAGPPPPLFFSLAHRFFKLFAYCY